MENEIKSVALIGLGAVGAVVAEKINLLSDTELFCIADDERKKRYESDGIFINGIKQNFNLVTPEKVPTVDLIIIATKNLQLKDALDEMKNAAGNKTMILSLLNGIQSEREIEKIFGEDKTLYGYIVNLESINLCGNITCTSPGKIVFGEKNNIVSDRIKSVQNLFKKAQIAFETPENIQLSMWKKFLINTVFNSLGAITRSPYGGFNFPVMQKLARNVGKEVIAVANAENIPLTEQMLEDDIKLTCSYTATGKCSMLQDTEAGRLTENPFFCGTIVELGKKHGIETPYCEFLGNLIEGTELVRTVR